MHLLLYCTYPYIKKSWGDIPAFSPFMLRATEYGVHTLPSYIGTNDLETEVESRRIQEKSYKDLA